jgi:outer membrane protein OmpA-like peptidoglycan-associated protein
MSISDMMSGLMLVFLFIAIGFMITVQSQKDAMIEVAQEYKDTKANLNEALYEEFEDDLKSWQATISKENIIIFDAPDVLFSSNSSTISQKFQMILDNFCPRLVEILQDNSFIKNLKEIRVEGHTSKDGSYLNNMQLSQQRAFSVLQYCYNLNSNLIVKNKKFIEKYFRANGMSYSKLRDNNNSKRVEFNIVLESEDKIDMILK